MTTDRTIGGIYRITGKLGEGGMGEVFKGFDTMLEREVAIKILHPELCRRPDLVERFHNEAVALGRMNHSNIATVYSFLKDSEQWFLVLEFVRGETLDKLIARRGALPWREAVKTICQALEGLEHAHRLGVVHRDIKPANIMLTPAGGLKLMDFGIARLLERARLTRTGQLVGTIEYMSPEQILGKDSDARGDIYSIGIVLYELLTGQVPFQKDSDYNLIRAQVEEEPTPPTVLLPQLPKNLERVVLTALQKNPTQRYASAAAFQSDLEGLLSTAPDHTNERPGTAPSETRIDIRNTTFTTDAQQPGSQTHKSSESAKTIAHANTHIDVFRHASQADHADLTGKSNTYLPSAWQRDRLWIVVTGVLLVTMGVILTLLLLPHDAPVASAPETSTLPQTTNKTDVKAEPDVVRTVEPEREPAPATKHVSVPNKVEPAAIATLDSADNQPAKKGTSSKQKTRKKVKTHSSQPANDWKVVEHQ